MLKILCQNGMISLNNCKVDECLYLQFEVVNIG